MSNTLPFLQGLVKRAACTILFAALSDALIRRGEKSVLKSFFRSSEQLRQAVRFFREFSVFWGH